MARIIGIAGSLRKASVNGLLLRAAAGLAPAGTTVEIASIRGIPLYDGDVEAESGVPAVVTELKERIAGAEGLLLVTPEYNNSVPGVFKNAIDWLTRPPKDIARVFRDKHVAVMGATVGPGMTIMAQAAWLPILRTLQTRPWYGGRMQLAFADKAFDAEGNLADDKVKGQVQKFMEGFALALGK